MSFRIHALPVAAFEALFDLPDDQLAARGVLRRTVDADVVDGSALAPRLARMLADPAVAYVHLHHARQGCYAARPERA